MRPDLVSMACRNGGVFTREEAKTAGYSERDLKTLTKPGGAWAVVRRGVYAERGLWDAAGDDGRYALEVRAVLLSSAVCAVPSHTSSGVLLGMPMRRHWRQLVHTTRPGVKGGRTDNGVKHHLAHFDKDDLCLHEGALMLGLARTAVDVAREHGFEDGVIAADAALRLGATRKDLERALIKMKCWPNVTTARAAVNVADGGAQNIGESLMRLMILELGIGTPETQFVAREGDRWASVDVRVGRHFFEFDGRIKYVGRDRGGVATKPVEEVLWEEKKREDWLRRYDGGYGMSRVIWPEMFGRERVSTMRRLAKEFSDSQAAYGQLP